MKSGLDGWMVALFLFPRDPFSGRLGVSSAFHVRFDALGLGSIVSSSVFFRDFSLKY